MRRKKHLKKSDERDTKKIMIYVIVAILLLFLIVICSVVYSNNKEKKYLSYAESGKVDYKVFLNENKFYSEEYINANQQYVSSLIKNIVADFKYDMKVSREINNNYKYRIDADVIIKDPTTKKTIYKHTEKLLQEKSFENNNSDININENVTIDFKYFNEIASNFINAYKLSSNNESILNVYLVVKTDKTEESKLTLAIPLTEQTIALSTISELAEDQEQLLVTSKSNDQIGKFAMIGLIICVAGFVYVTFNLIEYLLDTRTEESIYKSEVRKILLNYGEYINKTDDYKFKLDEYEIIRVQQFIDLIKIKEDLSRPILMIENKEKTSTLFAITDNTKFIYIFALNLHQGLLEEKNEEHKEKIGADFSEER